jgi:hypothetical protein
MRKSKHDPSQCFRTKSVGGRCHQCEKLIEDVAHVSLAAKAIFCERCCPACGEKPK